MVNKIALMGHSVNGETGILNQLPYTNAVRWDAEMDWNLPPQQKAWQNSFV